MSVTILSVTILSLSLVSVLCIFLFIRNMYLSKRIKRYILECKKPLRLGHITYDLSAKGTDKNGLPTPEIDFKSLVYVNELDRYTNGESRIEIQSIEPGIEENKVSKEVVEKFIKDKFKSLQKTSNIIWLESEQSIKDMRKEKLKKLEGLR